MRRATNIRQIQKIENGISIHALLAESDSASKKPVPRIAISIHALLAESDARGQLLNLGEYQFLSTLSLRRATLTSVVSSTGTMDFYPRSPCGERREPTALRTPHHKFLSTLSLRRATCYNLRCPASYWHFYPRSPCGERRGCG